MNTINDILYLIKTDFIIDKRSKRTFSNTVLYMLNTVILCYYSLKDINIKVWHVLFWIILLFAAINSTSRNINCTGNYRYIDILVKPIPLIISRLIYNTIIVFILGTIELTIFLVLTDNKSNYYILLIIVAIGAAGLASVLTFLAAIADKAQSNIGLVTILGCPLLLPTILSLIQISIELDEGAIDFASFVPIISLCVLVITSTILLFPYIWRE